MKLILKYVITAVIGAVLTWVTELFRDKRTAQQIGDDAVGKASDETQNVIKGTADARAGYTPASDPDDLARRLRERDRDPKAKAGSAGNDQDPGPVRIDPEPAKGNLPKPPDKPTA